ncbi:Moenomycin biosynthesis protein MoeN5 [Streptomyces sp. NPDC018057]|uniref:Moenomycin biosynthesis protein MoeN5 n=1 Tax=unclassified Streptomyces TaxID=2593676 RepID=UPI00379DAB32
MTLALPDTYTTAMLATESANRDHVTDFVARNGGSPELVAHTAALRLYLRVPHFLTEWIGDPPLRARVARALVSDIVAMKLLDDLMDDDTGLNRVELACLCLHLHLTAVREMCALAEDPRSVTDLLEHDFTTVCTGQIRVKSQRARDLDGWRAGASTYGASFLGCYGSLAAICGRVTGSVGPARRFAEAFGTIITIADDLTDYDRNGERAGNLGHLMRTGAVSAAEVAALLGQLRADALDAVRERPAALGLEAVTELYTADVLDRLLPLHTAP